MAEIFKLMSGNFEHVFCIGQHSITAHLLCNKQELPGTHIPF